MIFFDEFIYIYMIKLLEIFYSVDEENKIIQNLGFEYLNEDLEKLMENHRFNN